MEASEQLFHKVVHQAVDGYNEGVQVHGVRLRLVVWSPLIVGETVDPGQKNLHTGSASF